MTENIAILKGVAKIPPPLLAAISIFPLLCLRGIKRVGHFRFLRLSNCEAVAKSHNGGNPPHIHRKNRVAIRGSLFLSAGKLKNPLCHLLCYFLSHLRNHTIAINPHNRQITVRARIYQKSTMFAYFLS